MPNFEYKARDNTGKSVTGVMGGDDSNAIAAKLDLMGYVPVDIALVKKTSPWKITFAQLRPIKVTEINMFTRQLHTLQRAGLPLLKSLKAIAEQSAGQPIRKAVDQLARDIESGMDFSTALQSFPRVFNPLYVNMIRSGEVAGRLPEVLKRLADLGEHDYKLQLKIQGALRYPAIVVASLCLGFIAIISFVIPRFSHLYARFDTALPLPTRILIGIHHVVTNYWWLIILAVIVAAVMLRKTFKTSEGAYIWDRLRLRIPIFGTLFSQIAMSRFARITGTLMKSGVPILQILDLVAGSVGNRVIAKTITKIKDSVNDGRGMSEPMKESDLFPPVVVQMVAVGEETGKIDELLLHVSEYYDSQVEYTVENLVSLIEPFLIFILGLGVLLMALGIFMPMWNMMNLFKP